MSTEKRMLIALALIMGVLFIYESFIFKPEAERRRKEIAARQSAEQEQKIKEQEALAKKEAESPVSSSALSQDQDKPEAQKEAAISAQPAEIIPEEKIELDSTIWHATFTNRGASLLSFVTKQYHDKDKKSPRELVSLAENQVGPLAVSYGDFIKAEQMYKVVSVNDTELLFSTSSGSVQLTKRIKLYPESYLFDASIELTLNGSDKTSIQSDLDLWVAHYIGSVEEEKNKSSWLSPQNFQPQALCYTKEEKLNTFAFNDLKNSVTEVPTPLWTAIAEQYFITALVPQMNEATQIQTSCLADQGVKRHLLSALQWKNITVSSKPTTISASGFIGPKNVDLLKKMGVGLEKSVNWGWLGIICRPMLWALKVFYSFFHNWGIAVIFLTFLVKILLYPVSHKSAKSMREMQNLKPEMDRLKEIYGDDKVKFNEAMMETYKKHGINPFGGCLPILFQMPIWFALYRTLYSAVDLYQAGFIPGWLEDLSLPDPYYILPVALGIVTYIQQIVTPSTMDNMQAKIMKWFMPPFFTILMLSLPSGLTLYIFVNSVLSIFQQWAINRSLPPPSTTKAPAPKSTQDKNMPKGEKNRGKKS